MVSNTKSLQKHKKNVIISCFLGYFLDNFSQVWASIPHSYLKSALFDSIVIVASKKPMCLASNSTWFVFLLFFSFFHFFDGSHKSFQDSRGALFWEKNTVSSVLFFCSKNAHLDSTLGGWYRSKNVVKKFKIRPNYLVILKANHRWLLRNRKEQKE